MRRRKYEGRWSLAAPGMNKDHRPGPELFVWWPVGGRGYTVELLSPAAGLWHPIRYAAASWWVRGLLQHGQLMGRSQLRS